jgi:hypothetical protein
MEKLSLPTPTRVTMTCDACLYDTFVQVGDVYVCAACGNTYRKIDPLTSARLRRKQSVDVNAGDYHDT